ncbi:Lrp/AsnC family transcriptional regulator [Sphingomonas sp. ABOLD]|uniref:DNA-binding Lrp family transcriptional regulator n=1 Tax=Sphingomonas trueperi TaxID=53317 RepID=A0A7X5Y1R8_9SPHN|nr:MULTISPECIES: Lrp/AsnC family transcriptional regulator [Sphingomonas]NJB99488.1 DNA-binding Lrp family transcriptional regulator [Sphingomonas trueperi]RSV34637.1 Lrp/AsnC family transcriptional regulator [Sphingomonas sp. ABOLE]RSV39593.1 Lrp/AsnC family transcriptional regulator [Sphingomonas sp. ABOLD]
MNNSTTSDLDGTDLRILNHLVYDGRSSDVALGERVHLSSTATARRRKILEDRGVIRGYTAELNMAALGYGIDVLVSIELSSQAEQALNEFESAVVRCPSMSFCSFVSGETDFIMMIHVRSFEDYDRVYRRELSTLPHVARIRSSFLMRSVERRIVAPVVLDSIRHP